MKTKNHIKKLKKAGFKVTEGILGYKIEKDGFVGNYKDLPHDVTLVYDYETYLDKK